MRATLPRLQGTGPTAASPVSLQKLGELQHDSRGAQRL